MGSLASFLMKWFEHCLAWLSLKFFSIERLSRMSKPTSDKLAIAVLLRQLIFQLRDIDSKLVTIEGNQTKIMASQDEEAAAINALKDGLSAVAAQLNKALAEIQARIQALVDAVAAAGATSPAVDQATADAQAAAAALKPIAQSLDDLNPDTP